MTNHPGNELWLADARSYLEMARLLWDSGAGLHGVVHNAQLCVEYCTKSIIACFQVPGLIHNPGPELYDLIQDHVVAWQASLGEDMIRRLRLLARDSEEIAPWHGRSTYGQPQPDGTYVSPRVLCTEERARWALQLAERSLATAEAFAAAWRAAAG